MTYKGMLFGLCLVLWVGTAANAQDSTPRLTKEECVRLEDTFYDRPHRPDGQGFYQSDDYRRCRDAAFTLDPNAGLELLNALSGEGESLELDRDLEHLEQQLFVLTHDNRQSQPHSVLSCDQITKGRWCRGPLADDSEHFDALLVEPLDLRAGATERFTVHTDKPNYVLKSVFFDGQVVAFQRTGPTLWVVSVAIESGFRSDLHSLSAIFEWNGNGPDASRWGRFRKAVWYYKTTKQD